MTGEEIQKLYEDRNALVVAFAQSVRDYHLRLRGIGHMQTNEFWSCWHPPTDEDDADADEWAVVVVELPTGQATWHVPRELAETSGLPREPVEWDGHDREEKNARLHLYAGIE